MEQINKLFVKFLKDNNVFKQYVKNLKTQKKDHFRTWENHANPFTIMPLELCFNQARISDLIDCSFFWEGTQERHRFWSDLDSKWREIYHSHKHNLNI